MAFSGGNGSDIQGKVYWAVSADGLNWTVYNNGNWTPILYPLYADDCLPRDQFGGPAGNDTYANGITQIQLAYENGLFYLFMQFRNFWQGPEIDPNTGQLMPHNASTSLVYRMNYSSGSPTGVGSSVRQVFHNGVWENNSGQFVWDYDGFGADGTLLGNGDHVLGINTSMTSFAFGGGDVKYDPRTVPPTWVHVYTNDVGVNAGKYQVNTSLATNAWHAPGLGTGTSLVIGNLPSTTYNLGLALWYGNLSGVTNMYIWIPITRPGCPAPIQNLGILPGTFEP